MYKKAKERLRLFMEEWKKKDWIMMYPYTQKAWQMNHPQLVTELPPCQQYLEGINVLDYKIGSTHKSHDFARIFKIPDKLICIDVDVEIDYIVMDKEEVLKRKGKIRMVCEKDAYNLSETGTWGINVISILKKMKQEEQINEKELKDGGTAED